MESRSSELVDTLDKFNTTFRDFTSLYSMLVERGIEETEYGKTLGDIAGEFRRLYATAKSQYDALLLNKKQFEEGRLERDAFERRLTRIEEFIHEAEFDIGIKVLPHLKKVEKELLNKHVIEKIEEFDVPEEVKKEVKEDVEKIQEQMRETESKSTIDQFEEYVSFGEKIIKVGEKVWKFAEKVAPALPLVARLFGVL